MCGDKCSGLPRSRAVGAAAEPKGTIADWVDRRIGTGDRTACVSPALHVSLRVFSFHYCVIEYSLFAHVIDD